MDLVLGAHHFIEIESQQVKPISSPVEKEEKLAQPCASSTSCLDTASHGRWVISNSDGAFLRRTEEWSSEDPCGSGVLSRLESCWGGNSIPRWVDSQHYDWVPYGCTLEESAVAAKCIHNAGISKVVLSGDSHNALLVNKLSTVVNNLPAAEKSFFPEFIRDDNKDGHPNATLAHLCEYLQQLQSLPTNNSNRRHAGIVLVANFGQHPADGIYFTAKMKYLMNKSRYLKHFNSVKAHFTVFVFTFRNTSLGRQSLPARR